MIYNHIIISSQTKRSLNWGLGHCFKRMAITTAQPLGVAPNLHCGVWDLKVCPVHLLAIIHSSMVETRVDINIYIDIYI